MKTKQLIKKYHKLRGKNNPDLRLIDLQITYAQANKEEQTGFKREMRDYIDAVATKEIEAGQPRGRPQLPPLE